MAKKYDERGPYGYHSGVPDVVPAIAQGGIYYVRIYRDGSTRRVYSTGLGRSHTGKRWPADHPVSMMSRGYDVV